MKQALKNLSKLNEGNKVEIYIRFFLFPQMWFGQFEKEESKKEASQAYHQLIVWCKEKHVDINIYIANYLDGDRDFPLPELMEDEGEKFMVAVRFLANGDSSYIREVPPALYEAARNNAYQCLREELVFLIDQTS